MSRQIFQKLWLNQRRSCYKTVQRPNFVEKKRQAPIREAERIEISKEIKTKILVSGPITVADYMRYVLTNSNSGYYMHRDVFGKEGDFITSPEISQIFGELIGVWLLMEWRKLGSPPFQLVELGPGRGTLLRDVLRVFSQLNSSGSFSIHLVDISPYLSKIQAQLLCVKHTIVDDEKYPYYQKGETSTGIQVFWYKSLENVPHDFSLILAHEFFDALPVHKLQLDNGIWKEILIDVNEVNVKDTNNENSFRFVLSKGQTPISKIFQALPEETRLCLEYSLESECIINMLTERIQRDGGISLIIDYGHYGDKTDTFRAFKNHRLHDPLQEPGTADLTADVDFRQIRHFAERDGKVICFGPVEQGTFIKRMEGDVRLERLLSNALPANQKLITSGYEMLTSPMQMGSRFKFFAMFPAVMKDHLLMFPVHGFN